ncbi:hypothetical protein ES677_05115 [Bizionia gelidisalsuginis]|uniref:Lipoprotein n=1 Tax=Bizionia gelidisalsuginis TaxID=291188 RepID=A0ABY3MBQ9_9FLAO|nr:hypothetical protein [Bizionia gelidisalsuginis]TYC14761.1 hypothetical protein ES677_05115 [Bizionia gelidisalsuginis]
MRKTLFIILTIFFIQSCAPGEEQQMISVGNKYTLSIPSFLTQVYNLNDDASLQYQHSWKEFYVIAIDESKEEMRKALIENNLTDTYKNNIEGYSKLIMGVFKEGLSNSYQSKLIDTTINKMPAKLTTLSGTVEGIDVFYSIGIYEGKDSFYQVLAWTHKSKQHSYKNKMNKILYSLKDLKQTEYAQ